MLGFTLASFVGGAISVNLSGSSGSPNVSTTLKEQPATVNAGWKFLTDGTMQRYITDGQSYSSWSPDPMEWAFPARAGIGNRYWIKATSNVADDPNSGNSVGTWHALTSDVEFVWQRSALGTKSGSVKIEIATDSGGSNIVATGYYGGSATVDTGA